MADVAPAHPARVREGSTLAHAVAREVLYVPDEDHKCVHRVVLPLATPIDSTARSSFALPGRPAQVLALHDVVLVSVRDPGLLVGLEDDGTGLKEKFRVEVAADAWGLAVDPSERTVFVTSAWTHTVTAIDLASRSRQWSVDVAREPRAIVARNGRTLYVSHLTRSALTRIDIDGPSAKAKAKARDIELPAAPLRLPIGASPGEASLGWSLALSAAGDRLFAPRHALSATFTWRKPGSYPHGLAIRHAHPEFSWAGAGTVDTLLTADDSPLAPTRSLPAISQTMSGHCTGKKLDPQHPEMEFWWKSTFAVFGECHFGADFDVLERAPAFVQPRAMVLRRAKDTLLVASEGSDELVELDARAIDPSAFALSHYVIGAGEVPGNDADAMKPQALDVATRGGAPSGIALSSDDDTAWVFARSTYDLVEVSLDPLDEKPRKRPPLKYLRLAKDELSAEASLGRRIFYGAREVEVTGEALDRHAGLACAGCHPDGRDDGHVWHALFDAASSRPAYRAAVPGDIDLVMDGKIPKSEGAEGSWFDDRLPVPIPDLHAVGVPRQTPTLAGRLTASGPYGWHAQNPTLVARVLEGFALHRAMGPAAYPDAPPPRLEVPWDAPSIAFMPKHQEPVVLARALEAFLRTGLVLPPRDTRPLSAEEARGKVVFEDGKLAGCATCHAGAELTDKTKHLIPAPKVAKGFTEDPDKAYRTPSLSFVIGTAPYFHDGRAKTLEEVLDHNDDAMGSTVALSREDKAALLAYLRRL